MGFVFERQIVCPKCGHSTAIPTGKTHPCTKVKENPKVRRLMLQSHVPRGHAVVLGGKIYDMNAKAALGTVGFTCD